MCGRYLFLDEEEIYETRKILEDIAANFGKDRAQAIKTGEVFPGDTAAVLLQTEKVPVAEPIKWGYTLAAQKTPIINARSETVFEKPLFLKSLEQKRCLIPANAFYEWKAEGGKKIKYKIAVEDRPLIYLCGLYREFFVQNKWEKRFVILTGPANETMRQIHARMPLIVSHQEKDCWLRGSLKDGHLIEELSSRKIPLLLKAV